MTSSTQPIPQINTWRVQIDPPNYRFENATDIVFFVETGITTHPIVTIGDIAGFGAITGDIVAKGMEWNQMKGVAVKIRFAAANPGQGGLQLNIFQPGLRSWTGAPTVVAM